MSLCGRVGGSTISIVESFRRRFGARVPWQPVTGMRVVCHGVSAFALEWRQVKGGHPSGSGGPSFLSNKRNAVASCNPAVGRRRRPIPWGSPVRHEPRSGSLGLGSGWIAGEPDAEGTSLRFCFCSNFSQGRHSFVASPLGSMRERRCRSWNGLGEPEPLPAALLKLASSGAGPSRLEEAPRTASPYRKGRLKLAPILRSSVGAVEVVFGSFHGKNWQRAPFHGLVHHDLPHQMRFGMLWIEIVRRSCSKM